MIINAIMDLIYKAFMFLFGDCEPLRFNVSSTVYGFIHDFMAFIFFILPMEGLQTIFGIIVSIILFRVIVSLVKTLWDLLPFL